MSCAGRNFKFDSSFYDINLYLLHILLYCILLYRIVFFSFNVWLLLTLPFSTESTVDFLHSSLNSIHTISGILGFLGEESSQEHEMPQTIDSSQIWLSPYSRNFWSSPQDFSFSMMMCSTFILSWIWDMLRIEDATLHYILLYCIVLLCILLYFT